MTMKKSIKREPENSIKWKGKHEERKQVEKKTDLREKNGFLGGGGVRGETNS